MSGRLITRVVLRNYKSIAACDVAPAQLSFLVGPNGAGKSNFLDALRFVSDSLEFSIQHALRDRGGINEVRRRSGGHPTHFAIRVDFDLGEFSGNYGFLIGAKPGEGYVVEREECLVKERDEHLHGPNVAGERQRPGTVDPWSTSGVGPEPSAGEREGGTPRTKEAKPEAPAVGHFHFYSTRRGRVVRSTISPPPAAAPDRLYLVNVSGLVAFRRVYDALSEMGFYNLRPDEMRALQPPDGGSLLRRDGGNIASVVAALASARPELKRRIDTYLARMVPGIDGVDRRIVGPREALEFRRAVRGAKHSWRFSPNNVSDGTLRALGALVAAFQAPGQSVRRLVGIEEPEAALHPLAAGALVDALREAAKATQVLVTSHSVEMLNNPDIADASILAVRSEQGESRIGPLDHMGRSALQGRLYTAGELLRMDQLSPDPDQANLNPQQLDIFDQVVQPPARRAGDNTTKSL